MQQVDTHHVDGTFAEVFLCDPCVLNLRGEAFLDQELQQSRVVGRGPLRCGLRAPLRLSQQGLRSAVRVRGQQQLGDGGLEMLLLILVFVKGVSELNWNIF